MNVLDYCIKHSITTGRGENSLAFVDAEDGTRRLTWSESITAAKRASGGLLRQGIQPGDVVALLSRNDVYYGIAMMATALAGATFIGLPPQSSEQELIRFLRVCEAKWLFVEPGLVRNASQAATTAGISPENVLLFDTRTPSEENRVGPSFTTLLEHTQEDIDVAKDLRERPFFLVLTSGTTGFPKAAVISHRTQMARKTPPRASSTEQRALHPTPMYHATGAGVVMDAFLNAMTVYITRRTDACAIIDSIERYKITRMVSHPRLAEEVTQSVIAGKRPQAAVASLQSALLGGSMLTKQTFQSFKSILNSDAHVTNVYGCTEAGLVFAPGLQQHEDPSFVGTPPPGIEVRLIDPDTLEDVPADAEGEVVVRSLQVFDGYYKDGQATSATFLEDRANSRPFLRTGDKASFCSRVGQYRITGRYKEVMKVADGKEVSPEEVQEMLKSHELIDDAAVTSRAGRRNNGDVEPAAFVVARDRTSLTPQAIVDWVAKVLSPYKSPTGGVVFVESIPRTAFGKIMRHQLELPPADSVPFLTPMV